MSQDVLAKRYPLGVDSDLHELSDSSIIADIGKGVHIKCYAVSFIYQSLFTEGIGFLCSNDA